MVSRKTMLTIAVSTSLAGGMIAASNSSAADGFLDAAAKMLGVTADSANTKSTMKEGKCGEGKCGGSKGKKEGKCGGDKGKEGKCGEGKCGGSS